ncbi:hypothetical protein F5Y19DRAFT_332212 [Xylariaceae sp. FL1651]|nr:hypothetical protein F5Y19DRAFT_332212 [Xylariaceae sp. FL1651]
MANTTATVDSGQFENNAFSDFAPLLTLFGDEVTKQFLATSMSLADDVLLAVAPIGVITIIVSAIRTSGHRFMKSLIGRARESPDDEERELLSSTSRNVREIWNGRRVIRQTGPCVTKPFVFDKNSIKDSISGLGRFNQPSCLWPLEPESVSYTSFFQRTRFGIRENYARWFFPISETISPNLTTNIDGAVPSRFTVICFACLALLIQALVMVINALVFYRWRWLRAGKLVAPYGYPVWAAGTVSIALGSCICGWIIESNCWKISVLPENPADDFSRDGEELQFILLQKKIPDSSIPAYKLAPIRRGGLLRLTRRRFPPLDKDLDLGDQQRKILREIVTAIGVILALGGFITQNVGTRELHWSAGILQLGATLINTALRAWLRRRVGDPPMTGDDSEIYELKCGSEACELAAQITSYSCSLLIASRNHYRYDPSMARDAIEAAEKSEMLDAEKIISSVLKTQAILADWEADDPSVVEIATACVRAMHEIASLVSLDKHDPIYLRNLFSLFDIVLLERSVSNSPWVGKLYEDYIIGKASLGFPYEDSDIGQIRFCKAVISFTRYAHLNSGSTFANGNSKIPIYRILAHCSGTDVEAYMLLLEAWTGFANLQYYHVDAEPDYSSCGNGSQSVAFGLPFSASRYTPSPDYELALSGCLTTSSSPYEPEYEIVRIQHESNDFNEDLVWSIANELLSSFMLKLTRQYAREVATLVQSDPDKACKTLSDVLVKYGVCKSEADARGAMIPALIAGGVLFRWPVDYARYTHLRGSALDPRHGFPQPGDTQNENNIFLAWPPRVTPPKQRPAEETTSEKHAKEGDVQESGPEPSADEE